MVNREQKKSSQKQEESTEQDLRGTLISVLIVGAVIIGSWAGVWTLFLSR